jgi:prevent-host-death family protein
MTAARAALPQLVDRAQHEAVVLSRRGKRAAVLVSPAAFDRMVEALEDAADVAAYDAAMAEEGPDIPWEQVKTDLGLR